MVGFASRLQKNKRTFLLFSYDADAYSRHFHITVSQHFLLKSWSSRLLALKCQLKQHTYSSLERHCKFGDGKIVDKTFAGVHRGDLTSFLCRSQKSVKISSS